MRSPFGQGKGHTAHVCQPETLPCPCVWADQDECQNEVYCINGECLNTEGSYHCFCSLPLVLDATGNRCVNFSSRAGEPDPPLQHTFAPHILPHGCVLQEEQWVGTWCLAEMCQHQYKVQPGQAGGRSWCTWSSILGQDGQALFWMISMASFACVTHRYLGGV